MHLFDNIDNGKLKCRRCRNTADDPNAYGAESTYADCDSRRVVTRFPFALDGRDAVIQVRQGYMALAVGNDGSTIWLRQLKNRISNMPHGF